jgi:hypothetical protein
VPLLLLALLLPLALLALMPILLVQRYRAGTARQLARPWIATLTLAAMSLSTVSFLIAAALTTLWVPNAFQASAAGLAIGGVLGVLGLGLTRWEPTARTLHYTPNRWLVLMITFAVSARVLYGLARWWRMAQTGGNDASWGTTVGVPESLAAGAAVLGYYLVYTAGLRRRIHKWRETTSSVM